MTPTLKQLSQYYNLNKDTVQKWKKTRPKVYEALVLGFLFENMTPKEFIGRMITSSILGSIK